LELGEMTASPQIRKDLPEAFEILDPVWIAMPDGVKLAARILLPRSAKAKPVPAILEYIPYRRRDGTLLGDTPRHAYFAGHGYATVRVDLRGSGDSDGILFDEYLKQEHDDAIAVIAWLAGQPWCNGKVGMTGYSWGGFNSLQVAARRPPALKAIIPVHATDDRYGDDCHYMGGGLLLGNLSWASTMTAFSARPPDPTIVGERWRQMWLERLEQSPPLLLEWMAHPLRDEYWRHGSVAEDYSAITAAVYTVGGWADPYTNCVLRLLSNVKAPVKAMIGPWAHAYPHDARPGPQIGFLQESLRWFDRWLKDIDNGIEREPGLSAFIQESMPPASDYEIREGRWVREAEGPSPSARQVWYLGDGRLADRPLPGSAPLQHRSPETTGITTGEWCPYGNPGELPIDQRADDGRSLVFDSAVLAAPLEMLGTPVLILRVAIDKPIGIVTARLCDVAPDGASTLISYGVLNLTRRKGFDRSEPMVPGQAETVRIPLNDLGQRLKAGHRLRLAVSTNYWPILWPAPESATLTLHAADCRLELPVREAGSGKGRDESPFEPPEAAANVPFTQLRRGRRERVVEEEATTGRTSVVINRDLGAYRLEQDGLEFDGRAIERFSLTEGDPLSARAEIEWHYRMRRGDWEISTLSRTILTGDARQFRVSVTMDAFEGETRIFSREVTRDLPRVGL
jgi:putative CocE/NonD family hydrolase